MSPRVAQTRSVPARRWRENWDRVGLRGRIEPDHLTGRACLYGTGAEVCPIDDLQRFRVFPGFPTTAKYSVSAWHKFGHLTEAREIMTHARTLREGTRKAESWLDRLAAEQSRRPR